MEPAAVQLGVQALYAGDADGYRPAYPNAGRRAVIHVPEPVVHHPTGDGDILDPSAVLPPSLGRQPVEVQVHGTEGEGSEELGHPVIPLGRIGLLGHHSLLHPVVSSQFHSDTLDGPVQEPHFIRQVQVSLVTAIQGIESPTFARGFPQLVAIAPIGDVVHMVHVVGLERLPESGVQRAAREPEPAEIQPAGPAAFPGDSEFGGQFGHIQQFVEPMGDLQDGELLDVLICADTHAHVQERLGAVFPLPDAEPFHPHAGMIGRDQAHVVVHHIGDRRLQLRIHPEGRMLDIPLLRHVIHLRGRLEPGGPFIAQVREETAFQLPGLAGFRPFGGIEDVHGEIPRIQEHGRTHVVAHHLLQGDAAGPGSLPSVADCLGLRAGIPLEGARVRRPEQALFHAAENGGFRAGNGLLPVHPKQAGFLTLCQDREEQAQQTGFASYFHSMLVLVSFVVKNHNRRGRSNSSGRPPGGGRCRSRAATSPPPGGKGP